MSAACEHSRCEALCESQSISVGVVNVKFTRAPRLIDGPFVHGLRSFWITRCLQATVAELLEQLINVVGQDHDRLTEYGVAAMAGQENRVAPRAGEFRNPDRHRWDRHQPKRNPVSQRRRRSRRACFGNVGWDDHVSGHWQTRAGPRQYSNPQDSH